MTGPLDLLGRPLRDLRVSVTDRCNFRCRYCMPREVFGRDYAFLPRAELLTFEEITSLVRALVPLGLRKVRLTGGEPLLRRDLERLIALLAPLQLDLAVTTNGALLGQKAALLKAAGLERVTVSLDSLDEATFQRMGDTEVPLARVVAGLDAAAAVGLPVKVNAVVKRGENEEGLVDLAAFCRDRGHTLRLIEYMDVGTTNGWRLDEVVPAAELLEIVAAAFPLASLEPAYPGEVARRYRYLDGRGELGLISSVSQPFCGDCSRARLSADGKLYTCLFAAKGHDLKGLLRTGATAEELRQAVTDIWTRRVDRYSELRTAQTAPARPAKRVEMSYIGG